VRYTIRLIIFLCCSGNLLAAFATDVPRSGFAIVTVVSGNIADLVTTERLTNNITTIAEEQILPPSPFFTTASILVSFGASSEPTSAIAIANPSVVTGGVNLLLTDGRGGVVSTATVHLGPRGHISRFLTELFAIEPTQVPSPLLLTLSSEIPVAILAFNFRGAAFEAIPITTGNLIPPPASGLTPSSRVIGGNAVVFGQVAAGGGWSTQIVIANTSDGNNFVRIDFFGTNGIGFGSLTDIFVPPRGVAVLSTDALVFGLR
jgi:hypothetical protein